MGNADFLPMIKAPSGWPLPLVALVAMLALAGLDLVGAVAAKEWVSQRSVPALLLGAATFLALFWVYASSLQYAELALVTMGWVAMLQVGLLVIDRVRYGVELPAGKWAAVVLLLAAQGYLLLAPTSSSS